MQIDLVRAGVQHSGGCVGRIFSHQIGQFPVHGILAAHQIHHAGDVVGRPEGVLPQRALIQILIAYLLRISAPPGTVGSLAPQQTHGLGTDGLLAQADQISVFFCRGHCILTIKLLIPECLLGILFIVFQILRFAGLLIQDHCQLGDCPIVIAVFHHLIDTVQPVFQRFACADLLCRLVCRCQIGNVRHAL